MDSNIALNDLREEGHLDESYNFQNGLRRRVRTNSEAPREFSLPEADGGRDAWLFLAGCFMVEALIWGETSRRM